MRTSAYPRAGTQTETCLLVPRSSACPCQSLAFELTRNPRGSAALGPRTEIVRKRMVDADCPGAEKTLIVPATFGIVQPSR